jgi:hypothetical protein
MWQYISPHFPTFYLTNITDRVKHYFYKHFIIKSSKYTCPVFYDMGIGNEIQVCLYRNNSFLNFSLDFFRSRDILGRLICKWSKSMSFQARKVFSKMAKS